MDAYFIYAIAFQYFSASFNISPFLSPPFSRDTHIEYILQGCDGDIATQARSHLFRYISKRHSLMATSCFIIFIDFSISLLRVLQLDFIFMILRCSSIKSPIITHYHTGALVVGFDTPTIFHFLAVGFRHCCFRPLPPLFYADCPSIPHAVSPSPLTGARQLPFPRASCHSLLAKYHLFVISRPASRRSIAVISYDIYRSAARYSFFHSHNTKADGS